MNCDPKRLSFYLDGELSQEEVRELREHLDSCQSCTDDLARYTRIEQSVRRLGRKPPPSELRRTVYRLVEERRAGRWRTRLKSVLRTPAAPLSAVVVLAVGTAVAWRTLVPTAAPVMTAAFAVQESPDSLDGVRVELVFDRPISADSVVDGVAVDPPLPFDQRVFDNKVELIPRVPLLAGSSYTVIVSNVRDQRGNVQLLPVVLSLSAEPVAAIVQQSPPPEPLASAAPAPSEATEVDIGSSGAAGSLASSAQTKPAARPAPAATSQAITASLTGLNSNGGGPAMATGNQPLPTAIAVGSTLGVGAILQQAVPTLPVLATSSRGPSLLEVNPDVQHRLGQALAPESLAVLGEQAFQGGAMLSRSDSNQIYSLARATGRWQGFENGWRRGEVLTSVGVRPPGTLEPLRGFGKIWREQPAVKLQLGWPVYDQRDADGAVQAFEGGTLVRSAYGVAYAIFNDGTWRTLPDPRT